MPVSRYHSTTVMPTIVQRVLRNDGLIRVSPDKGIVFVKDIACHGVMKTRDHGLLEQEQSMIRVEVWSTQKDRIRIPADSQAD